MVLQTNSTQEANEMLSTKTRSFIIGLAVSATGLTGIASAGARPVTGVQRPVAPVSRAVALTGHTTGAPGAASEEACQAIGEEANAQYLLASLNLPMATFRRPKNTAQLARRSKTRA
jgi:hypothetical protein